ncbi:hypothetical protein EVAR_5575_1 [Eumeta japonica]|uniref:Uncharacterized protein n=1 Tax=Eumeta variegata TaxID=151549 RepID=A0A4C1U1C0_EUMVA|nr:hypothetical protein EVAR_5575_1 [Eumeta japonica]
MEWARAICLGYIPLFAVCEEIFPTRVINKEIDTTANTKHFSTTTSLLRLSRRRDIDAIGCRDRCSRRSRGSRNRHTYRSRIETKGFIVYERAFPLNSGLIGQRGSFVATGTPGFDYRRSVFPIHLLDLSLASEIRELPSLALEVPPIISPALASVRYERIKI